MPRKSKLLTSIFVFQFILSCIDLVAIAVSPGYRNVIGNIKNHMDLLSRLSPSIYVFIACGACLYSYLNLNKYSKVLIYVLTTIFVLSTIISFVPWVGLFSVLLTPVSVLYYGILFWITQYAYFTILIMLGLYLFLNMIILVKLKNEK